MMLTFFSYFIMILVRNNRATHFGNINTLKKVHGFTRFDVSPMILIIKIVLIGIIFLVATESVEIRQIRPVANQDYVILLDSSTSMAKRDFEPDRLSAAKDISKKWVGVLAKNSLVGFVSFSQDIGQSVSLTENKKKIREAIDSVYIDYSKSGTSIDYAINYGLDIFKDDTSGNDRVILLLTDGTQDVSPETIVRINSMQARVFSFGIGEKEGGLPEEFMDDEIPEDIMEIYNTLEFNFTKLQELSEKTGGKAFQVSNADELNTALADATFENVKVKLNSSYYMLILIALISILEFVIYSKLGGL